MVKNVLVLILTIIVFAGCTGKQPQSDWTAEEYFRYAKEKYDDEDYFESVRDFTVVILRYAGSAVADSAQFFLACSHFYMDEYIISAAEFSKLINDMPQSPLVSEAQYMLGESYYQMSPRAELDQQYSWNAVKEFQIFLEDYPTSPRREEVEKKIIELREKFANKYYKNAELYRKMRNYNSSIIYYNFVLSNYYDTDFADDAQYGKALSYIELEDFLQAKEELLIFLDKFPDSKLLIQVKEKLKEINRTLAENDSFSN